MRGDIERRIDILVTQMSAGLSAGLKSRLNAWPIQICRKTATIDSLHFHLFWRKQTHRSVDRIAHFKSTDTDGTHIYALISGG